MTAAQGSVKGGSRSKFVQAWLLFATRLFAGEPVCESVATRFLFCASPETVWKCILFYEDVPGRLPWLLGVFLPRPLRSVGDKTKKGARVRCVYEQGELVKCIRAVEPPHSLRFDVVDQKLGLESVVQTTSGSYQITAWGNGAEVVLVTNYRAFLHPRFLCRPVEAFLVRQLHRHILRGVGATLDPAIRTLRHALAPFRSRHQTPPGGLACTTSGSGYRR